MTRTKMILCIGKEYHTSNIEGGEYSYVQEAGSRAKLEKAVGHPVDHFKLDIRFELNDIVVLIETKQSFVEKDELQLAEYVEEELALHMLISQSFYYLTTHVNIGKKRQHTCNNGVTVQGNTPPNCI